MHRTANQMARLQLAAFKEKVATYSNEGLRTVWLRTLPHIAKGKPAEVSPAWREVYGLISQEWLRRQSLDERDDQIFRWPSTDAPEGSGRLGRANWPDEGMLAFLGYHVGEAKGLPTPKRHFVLSHVFLSNLPPINGPDYLREWGMPGTAHRLEKLANALAAFARNGKRAGNRTKAVGDWEADLDFLYTNYYVGRFGFVWPKA